MKSQNKSKYDAQAKNTLRYRWFLGHQRKKHTDTMRKLMIPAVVFAQEGHSEYPIMVWPLYREPLLVA
jgi:hypothetical protein